MVKKLKNWKAKVTEYVNAGRTVMATNLYKESTGASLSESLKAIHNWGQPKKKETEEDLWNELI